MADARGSADLFTVTVEGSRVRPHLNLAGELDSYTASRLRDVMEGVIENGAVEIVVDLGRVDFVASEGLAAFVGAAKQLEHPGRLVLRAPSPTVRKLLEITGLRDFFGSEPHW